MPLYYREAVMASLVGYAAVRTRPLDATDFNLWWMALDRHALLQSQEGIDQLRQRQGIRIAMAFDDSLIKEKSDQTPMNKATLTTVASSIDWTKRSVVLAALDPDDPRAIFLRKGGRLDREGNPILPRTSSPPGRVPTPPMWRGN